MKVESFVRDSEIEKHQTAMSSNTSRAILLLRRDRQDRVPPWLSVQYASEIASSIMRLRPVFPSVVTLPMEFSWSLYFAHSAHEAIAEKEGQMKRADRVAVSKDGLRFRAGCLVRIKYVDNYAA